ncbi:TPA: hypothetical protein ACGVK3_001552 [Enterococcus faecium]|uniref:hypothetical protein n=1 Tax=Enterococcus faecium TaxID=1352 RepID=UPI000FD7F13E|nr:hypothetical protein [Enterococcus faecium]MBD9740577.1 hypothetical protein [Enterococcus faecium]MBD9743438.1 hypothetical protein [Enterococcus faecium]MBD9754018.1 hypothetical protein [Enterococcus faecium]MBD9800316.1 hypothetical protein [Enterococcus faecium]MBD9805758.1 hypothetical protein [Enterococcus faecium]
MIQLAGIQTGKIYFSGESKSEASQWLLKTFTNNKKLRKNYPNEFLKDDQIMPEPMLLVRKKDNE